MPIRDCHCQAFGSPVDRLSLIDPSDTGFTLNGIWWWLVLWPPSLWFVRRVYQTTRPPITPRATLGLQILRSATYSLILALLTLPILTYVLQQARYPVVVTLIDNSQSMLIQEEGRSRWSTVTDTLASGLEETLQRSKAGLFAARAQAVGWRQVVSTTPAGHATDISAALEEATRWGEEAQRLHSIVLISDGRHNLGADPVFTAQGLGVPVYTLGVGAATFPDDIQIASVDTPPILFAGRGSTIAVAVRQWGFDGQSGEIEILIQDSLLATVSQNFGKAGETVSFHIPLPPLPSGLQSLSVRIKPQPGEITQENNTETALVLVRPHRLRVTLVAGGPSPDFAFLRRTLAADSSLTCQFLVSTSANSADIPPDLSQVDILVLHDLSREQLDEQLISRVRQFVYADAGALLFVAGERFANSGGLSANSDLPLLAPSTSLLQPNHPVQIAEHGQHHPAIRPVSGGGPSWSDLPPLLGVAADLRRSGDATLLLEVDDIPVARATTFGQGRLISVAGSGFWRLDLLASGADESPDTIRRFWRQSVQWLGLPEAARRVRSEPVQRVVKHGQPSRIRIEVFDELMQPFPNAEFTFQLNGQPQRPSLERLGSGRYLASWSNLPPGEYSYHLRAMADDIALGADEGRFVIAEQSIEMSDQRRDEAMLQRIAQSSGGAYRPLSQWRQLADRLSPPPVLASKSRQIGIDIDQYWWLVVFVGLLSAEWGLRKRWGLL